MPKDRTEYLRDYYQRNKERIREVQRIYRNAHQAEYRAKRKLIPPELRNRRRSVWDHYTIEEKRYAYRLHRHMGMTLKEARGFIANLRREVRRPQPHSDRAGQSHD